MHEMSLAMSLIEIVEREMKSHPGRRLSAIEIEIGEQAGIERQSFDTALAAVVGTSRWPDARIVIVERPAMAECLDCGRRFHPGGNFYPTCPDCGSNLCGIIGGREFRLTSLSLK